MLFFTTTLSEYYLWFIVTHFFYLISRHLIYNHHVYYYCFFNCVISYKKQFYKVSVILTAFAMTLSCHTAFFSVFCSTSHFRTAFFNYYIFLLQALIPILIFYKNKSAKFVLRAFLNVFFFFLNLCWLLVTLSHVQRHYH